MRLARNALLAAAVATTEMLTACGGDPHPDVTKVRSPDAVAAGEAILAVHCAVCRR